MLNKLEKIGYILIGVGIGGIITTCVYKHELDKPIGEIEEYIPYEDREDAEKEEDSNESDKPETFQEVSSQYRSTDDELDDRRIEFEKRRHASNNQTTRYSKMYQGKVEGNSPIHEIVHTSIISDDPELVRKQRLEELGVAAEDLEEAGPEDDIAIPDDGLDDSELVRERVETNFEIYLGEGPTDFVPLVFYEGDNTLADDHERIVPAAFDIVGEVALSRLITGGPGAEEGVIYVRNLKTMIDYEIVLDAGSYSNTVLGIFTSKQEPQNDGADRNGRT